MKLFPLHLIPNDTKIDFMRLRKPVLILMLVIAVASVGVIVGKGRSAPERDRALSGMPHRAQARSYRAR